MIKSLDELPDLQIKALQKIEAYVSNLSINDIEPKDIRMLTDVVNRASKVFANHYAMKKGLSLGLKGVSVDTINPIINNFSNPFPEHTAEILIDKQQKN